LTSKNDKFCVDEEREQNLAKDTLIAVAVLGVNEAFTSVKEKEHDN
jgi:hypothetical protein